MQVASIASLVVREVDPSLDEAAVAAALESVLGSPVRRVSRFSRSRRGHAAQPVPLPLVRVECATDTQQEELLRCGSVVINGARCPVSVALAAETSSAALGKQHVVAAEQVGRNGTAMISRRARALASKRRVPLPPPPQLSVELVALGADALNVRVRLLLPESGGSGSGRAGASTGPAPTCQPCEVAPQDEEAWPLHAAAARGDVDALVRLLDRRDDASPRATTTTTGGGAVAGAGAVAAKPNGLTPLMVAAEHGHVAAARLLLARGRGAAASVGQRSHAKLTAAQYARTHGHAALAAELDAHARLQPAAPATPSSVPVVSCPVCGERLKPRPNLHYLRERAARGDEPNPLVSAFCASGAADALARPVWHGLNNHKHLRKEASESLAVLAALRRLPRWSAACRNERAADTGADGSGGGGGGGGSGSGGSVGGGGGGGRGSHVLDLCSGKGLTAALAALEEPSCVVSAIDLLLPSALPHFEEALPPGRLHYVRLDLLGDGFVRALEARVEAVARPAFLLGVHLCGELSLRAIEAFGAIARVEALLLVPCCLPNRALPAAPPWLYASPQADEQAAAWCSLLEARCRELPGVRVTSWREPHIASAKRFIVMVERVRTVSESGG